jgi:type IV secretory pathway VirJ component
VGAALLCAACAAPAPKAQQDSHRSDLDDLPLRVIPAAFGQDSPWFAVFLSGDGGWARLDRGVASELARRGIAVVGWDSLRYFWTARDPQGSSEDLDRVMRHYANLWGKSHVLLIGYSQGADTMPFMANRLAPASKDQVGLTALLGISDNALFEFHLMTWVRDPGNGLATAAELARWSGAPYVCLYGEHDRNAACEQVTGAGGEVVKMAGGHHFDGRYAAIAAEILKRLPPL